MVIGDSWTRLVAARDYYRVTGQFEEILVPWTVPVSPAMATMGKPPEALCWRAHRDMSGGGREDRDVLIGSAEQAILHQRVEGLVRPGRYMALTPCFRNETDHYPSALHLPYFMKLELWEDSPGRVNTITVDLFASFAERFFDNEARSAGHQVAWERTEEGWDLTLGGVEIGSYGIRRAKMRGEEHSWVYATGLAEPRFGHALAIATGGYSS